MNGKDSLLDELRDLVARHTPGQENATPFARVTLARGEFTTGSMFGVYEPMLCLVVQGSKHVAIGNRILDFNPGHYFMTSVEVPATGRISRASHERPYLAIAYTFDQGIVADLLSRLPPAAEERTQVGFATAPVLPEIIESWTRMLRLLDNPDDIPVLGPLLEQEMVYRLLKGPHSSILRQIARNDGGLGQIRRSLAWISDHLAHPLRIDELAKGAAMSRATFHRHFKAATAMSPLQYQKTLRLQQARRMLVVEKRDATQLAFAVGYESPSQFSREYARQFGAPPMRDVARERRPNPRSTAH